MTENVWEWLTVAREKWPDRTAYVKQTGDAADAITFGELHDGACRIASLLPEKTSDEPPAVVLCDKSIATLLLYWGVIASGRAYAPLDPSLPAERIRRILTAVQPALILADVSMKAAAEKLSAEAVFPVPVLWIDTASVRMGAGCEAPRTEETGGDDGCAGSNTAAGSAVCGSKTPARTQQPAAHAVSPDRNPLYCVFTSGSSGTPKGVLTSHASLINYIEGYGQMMDMGPEDVLGNQSPLDYIAAIRDIYLPVRFGCRTVLLDKGLFMQPVNLFEALESQGVTALGWSTSALTVIASLNGLAEGGPKGLAKVCFSGSVMPAAVLRQWQDACPGTRFVNQYGPTEATASCTYYVIDHPVEEGEEIPIGRPYPGYEVFLLQEDGTPVPQGERGEICVGGAGVTLGYLADPVRTAAAFQEQSFADGSVKRIYHTGDLGWQDETGVFHFCGRLDRQIKHMGHRVEPEEIEAASAGVPGVSETAVVYNARAEQLVLVYTGEASVKDIAKALRKVLPGFMVPRKILALETMPKLSNGKTDYSALAAAYGQ